MSRPLGGRSRPDLEQGIAQLARPPVWHARHRQRADGPAWARSRVQSLLFDVEHWTRPAAVAWARTHRFVADKVHRTDRYLRLRQFSPTPGAPKRTIRFGHDPSHVGISAVVEATPPSRTSRR